MPQELDGLTHVSSLTQEEPVEPLALSVPGPEESAILKGIDKGGIVSSEAPQISKDGSSGRSNVDNHQRPAENKHSVEDPQRTPSGNGSDVPNALDGLTHVSSLPQEEPVEPLALYVAGPEESAILKGIDNHQRPTENKCSVEAVREVAAAIKSVDEGFNNKDTTFKEPASTQSSTPWRSSFLADPSRTPSAQKERQDGNEMQDNPKKKDVFRPTFLDSESYRRDRLRDEERDTNISARKDRWREVDKEFVDNRKTDRWVDNSPARHVGEARWTPADKRADPSKEMDHDQRHGSKWSSRWGPGNKPIDKKTDAGKYSDMPFDQGLPHSPTPGKDEKEGDRYRPWRSSSLQGRGRGDPPHHHTPSTSKEDSTSDRGKGHDNNSPSTFSAGCGRVNHQRHTENNAVRDEVFNNRDATSTERGPTQSNTSRRQSSVQDDATLPLLGSRPLSGWDIFFRSLKVVGSIIAFTATTVGLLVTIRNDIKNSKEDDFRLSLKVAGGAVLVVIFLILCVFLLLRNRG